MYAAFNLWLFQRYIYVMQQFEFVSVQRKRKRCSKTREIVGVDFFSLELNCLVIWRIFLVVNLAAVVDLELIANFG